MVTFLADKTVEAANAQVKTAGLYAAYKLWAEEVGKRPMSRQKFNERLRSRGLSIKTVNGTDYWSGLGVRIDA